MARTTWSWLWWGWWEGKLCKLPCWTLCKSRGMKESKEWRTFWSFWCIQSNYWVWWKKRWKNTWVQLWQAKSRSWNLCLLFIHYFWSRKENTNWHSPRLESIQLKTEWVSYRPLWGVCFVESCLIWGVKKKMKIRKSWVLNSFYWWQKKLLESFEKLLESFGTKKYKLWVFIATK